MEEANLNPKLVAFLGQNVAQTIMLTGILQGMAGVTAARNNIRPLNDAEKWKITKEAIRQLANQIGYDLPPID
jgi:hypothetical protein